MRLHRCVVIIVAYNCWDHLFCCLDALSCQTCADFRMIVVNNGKPDPGQEKRLAQYERLTYLQSSGNLGFAAGNNQGIALAGDCQWIALLNPDTIPAPDWMEKMLQAADAYPDYAVLGSVLVQADKPHLMDGAGDGYHVSGFVRRSGLGLPVDMIPSGPWEVFSPCAAAAFYRAGALRAVGGLDEDFFCYLEDVDLGFRLRLAGCCCLTVPDARVKHVGSAVTVKYSDFYVYYGQRNLVWAFVKNMPGPLFWVFLPLHIGINLAGILRYLLKGRARVVLRAKRDAISDMPGLWRKRCKVQQRRTVSLRNILSVLNKGVNMQSRMGKT
ncbi:MAG: glycosyltransferase family 2 protein [Desulfotignum sp.]|nr:glycosyltransferase family 2 protein [Desulfotignum sp.]